MLRINPALVLLPVMLLSGCGAADRLKNVGKAPDLSKIENPTAAEGYKPVRMPMPEAEPVSYTPNSLWQNGSRAFFKDQRARRVGDILTVNVDVTDSAKLDNTTSRSRSASESLGAGGGLDGNIVKALTNVENPATTLGLNSGGNHTGAGTIDRSESVTTNVAAVVTQVLPNGNLVIEGRQEIRVNFEVRELIIAGIVRPEDISSRNTVASTKIAEARISYGGRGQISDVQQPRYGQQVADILLPF